MIRNPMALRRIAIALLIAGLAIGRLAYANVSLNFANADIDQIAKAIGAATGKTIIVDPRVKGQLNLVSENPVPEGQAIKTLQSALRMQGFALVQDNGVLKVVPEADAKLQGVPTYVGDSTPARGDQVITQVFELHNESANNLLPVLRPLISPNNTIAAYPANNTLVVTDYADNVRRIAAIIAGVDNEAGHQIDIVALKNANAHDVVQQLAKMLDPGTIGSTDATLKVAVTPDPRTNSVMIRASNKTRLAMAKKLAQRLDAPSTVPGNMHVVHLRNANAVQLAKTLRGMMGKSGGETASSGSSAESTSTSSFNQGLSGGDSSSTGTAGTPPLPSYGGGASLGGASGGSSGGMGSQGFLGQKQGSTGDGGGGNRSDENHPGGMIQADAATNSLVVTASEPIYRNLRAVIDQLDQRRAQVYIEALIVELTATTGANLGIQWQRALLSGSNNNGIYAGSNFGTSTSNIVNLTAMGAGVATSGNLSSSLSTLTSTGAPLLPNGLNIGLLNSFGNIFGLGGLLQALSTSADSNVLSSPNLITLDNEEAKIVVGSNVPILSGGYTTPSGSTSGISTYNSYNRQDVGTVLHLKPQITDGGLLKLQLYAEVSSVDQTTVNNPGGFTITKRTLQSTVLADNGEIIVLGGLMGDTYTGGTSKVPLLGDIPWIGQLFRSENKIRSKDNLMVFLRPVIVRDENESAAIAANRYEFMRWQQQGYETDNRVIKDNDVPVIPPVPPSPRQGANPVDHLFDLGDRTRQPGPQPAPSAPPAPPAPGMPESGQPAEMGAAAGAALSTGVWG